MTAYGPKAHLGSAVINWAPPAIKAPRRRAGRQLATAQNWWGVKGAIDLVSIAEDVPADIKGQGGCRQGRSEGRQLRDLEGPHRGQHRQDRWTRTLRPMTNSSPASAAVQGVDGQVPGGDKKSPGLTL